MKLVRKMAEEGLIRSFSEGRRVIIQGGVKVNDVAVSDLDAEVEPGDTIQLGKREAIRLDQEPDSKSGAV